MPSRGQLSAELTLQANELLYVRMFPEGVRRGGLDDGQRLAACPAVAVELLQEEFGSRDAGLGDGEVTACDDTLETLSFWQQRLICEGGL